MSKRNHLSTSLDAKKTAFRNRSPLFDMADTVIELSDCYPDTEVNEDEPRRLTVTVTQRHGDDLKPFDVWYQNGVFRLADDQKGGCNND